MKYEVLYPNDNGTYKVRLTIDGQILEQDFVGKNAEELKANIQAGMAVFQAEIEAKKLQQDNGISELMGKVQALNELPPVSEPRPPVDNIVEQ